MKQEHEVLRTFILILRALADIKRHLGLEGVEDLRRQADEMEKREAK